MPQSSLRNFLPLRLTYDFLINILPQKRWRYPQLICVYIVLSSGLSADCRAEVRNKHIHENSTLNFLGQSCKKSKKKHANSRNPAQTKHSNLAALYIQAKYHCGKWSYKLVLAVYNKRVWVGIFSWIPARPVMASYCLS